MAWQVHPWRRMTREELSRRSTDFAVAVARMARTLPWDAVVRPAVDQLVRASASVAANYRATGHARSRKEFVAKLGVVVEEADECVFWFEYLRAVGGPAQAEVKALEDESKQLAWIFKAAAGTARRNANLGPSRRQA